MKKIFLSVVILIFCINFTGCTYEAEIVSNELENDDALILDAFYEDGQTSVTDIIPVPGENFSLMCTYDTGDYPLSDWRITANKTINMTVNTDNLPEDYQVYIEHVHADIVLKSTIPQVDGITQDTMDDSDHRTPTNGFPISDEVSYNNVFSIEAYTDEFYQMWGYACGNYGSISSGYQRMTEGNLRKAGTYAEKLIVVYDIIITPPGETEGYVRSIYSEILIPLTSEINYVEKDFFTDKIIESKVEK